MVLAQTLIRCSVIVSVACPKSGLNSIILVSSDSFSVSMTPLEIRSWFDKAFDQLYQADFAQAAAYFEQIIENAGDLYAVQIARRDLKLCFPLQELTERLQVSPYPLSLTELLQHGTYPLDLATHLRKFRSIYELDDEWWVAEPPLRFAIQQALAMLLTPGQPITLQQLTPNLFADRGLKLTFSSRLAVTLRAIIRSFQEIILVENDCLFNEPTLGAFVTDLADLIRAERKPQSLRDAIAMTPWSPAVITNLDANSLSQVIRSKSSGALVEIAPDLWVTHDFINLSRIQASEIFADPYESQTTDELLHRLLIVPAPDIHLHAEYVRRQSIVLEMNSHFSRVAANRWVSRASFDSLIDDLLQRFAGSDGPIVPTNLISELAEIHPGISSYRKSLAEALVARLELSPDTLRVTDVAWMHRFALPLLLDQIYSGLQGQPRTIKQLRADFVGQTIHPNTLRSDFTIALNDALHADDRFILDKHENWHAIPPGNRLNNIAYWALHGAHRPLTWQEIAELAREYRGRVTRFELVGDRRFTQLPNARWMLAEWMWLNDLAAQYLTATRTPQTKSWILEHVCEANGIVAAHAIFEPEGDARFIRDPFGRWLCTSAGTLLTREMLDHLVEDALSRTWGVSLEQLIRDAFRRPISDFLTLEETILNDQRLIVCEGMWYPRDAIQTLSLEDIQNIKLYLASNPYPVSSVELAKACLHTSLCLTNLTDVLGLEPDLIQVGGAAWLLRANQSDAIGRRREVNYPIHSGKYIPSVSPDLLVEADYSFLSQPIRASDARIGEAKPRPTSVTIALIYEDVRDGSLEVALHLRQFLDSALDLPAFTFTDNAYREFLCWYDAENNLIHGFGPLFQQHGLTYGDKVRFSLTRHPDTFSVETTGQRNDQVFREALRHSQVEDWRQEALRSNRSYHDLVLEVLDQFKAPMHVDDLYSLVDVRRTAKKSTISAILSSHSYLVSTGRGYWRFDEQEYLKMIRELQSQVATLNQQIEQRGAILQENLTLREQNAELRSNLAGTRALSAKTDANLTTEQEAKAHLEKEVATWKAECSRIQREMQDSLVARQSLDSFLQEQTAENLTLQQGLAVRNAEIHSLQVQLQSEKASIEEVRAVLVERAEELQRTYEAIRRMEVELSEVRSEDANKNLMIVTLKEAFEAQKRENSNRQEELDKRQGEIDHLNEELSRRSIALSRFEGKDPVDHGDWDRLRAAKETQGNELSIVQHKLREEQERVHSLGADLKGQAVHIAQLQMDLENLQRESAVSASYHREQSAKIQSLEQMLQETTLHLNQSRNHINEVEHELEVVRKEKDELRDGNNRLSTDLMRVTSTLMLWQSQFREAEVKESEMHSRISEMEEQLGQCKTEVQTLRLAGSTLEAEVARIRSERNDIAQLNERLCSERNVLSVEKEQNGVILNSRLGHLARWWLRLGSKTRFL